LPSLPVHTIDLKYRGIPRAIGAYLIPHDHGVILVESGPSLTLHALQDGLNQHGYTLDDVSDVLLTHVHLDHAGAAGKIAQHGAQVYAHAIGAPHLVNPAKLLASAERIYGNQLRTLWGEFEPVPQSQIVSVEDGNVIDLYGLRFYAMSTPGHANHHLVYIVEDICFSGDIGGVRLGNTRSIQLPTPPPEFHLEWWRQSINKLSDVFRQQGVHWIVPTHFGLYDDPGWHMETIRDTLDALEEWIETNLTDNLPVDQVRRDYADWLQNNPRMNSLPLSITNADTVVNPSGMSADGLYRYWKKYRHENGIK
jgi:glyoxylase-like metal-dependent hydrolase (beta-lactamase superfamily II)